MTCSQWTGLCSIGFWAALFQHAEQPCYALQQVAGLREHWHPKQMGLARECHQAQGQLLPLNNFVLQVSIRPLSSLPPQVGELERTLDTRTLESSLPSLWFFQLLSAPRTSGFSGVSPGSPRLNLLVSGRALPLPHTPLRPSPFPRLTPLTGRPACSHSPRNGPALSSLSPCFCSLAPALPRLIH